MTDLLLWAAIVLGAGNFALLVRQGMRPRTPEPRKLRPCSCGHGLGRHDKNGCGYRELQVQMVDGELITNAMGNPVLSPGGRPQFMPERKEQVFVCGCKAFDGEIPSDMVGREFLGLPGGE